MRQIAASAAGGSRRGARQLDVLQPRRPLDLRRAEAEVLAGAAGDLLDLVVEGC